MKLDYPDRPAAIKEQARDILSREIAIDLHSHLGLFHRSDNWTARGCDDMRAGHVDGCVAAVIGDKPVIARTESGIRTARDPELGELAAAADAALGALHAAVGANGAVLALNAADLEAARAEGKPAVIAAIEGLDSLEGDLSRLGKAHQSGVRVAQLVHYRINELGDIQTEPARHHGLTAFGAEVVREAERLGLIVDLAHATYEVTRDTVNVASRPVIISHTVLGDAHPRCVSPDHARLVAETGGVIGVWPSMLAVADFGEFIDGILRLVETIGIDHVGIGTDMDAVKNPVYSDYGDFPVIPEALLAAGMRADDIGKIIGGNFQRLFAGLSGG
ncbi:MAG: dipeptidase [Rhodospirillales bacterium]|nr:dipeptidase [Rhodospirillales bacterium]